MKIYGDTRSGNCYKLTLVCALLDIDHDWVPVDVIAGETRTSDFLARNPVGKIPVLELDDGRTLWESNAILNYLAEDSPLLPVEPFTHAKILQWQFFEQYSHEPCIAVARFIQKYQGLPEERRAEYESKHAGGYKALQVMEDQLVQTHYLAGDRFTVADICLYAYTHVADEGGFDLSGYPAINAWLGRVSSAPGYVYMEQVSVS